MSSRNTVILCLLFVLFVQANTTVAQKLQTPIAKEVKKDSKQTSDTIYYERPRVIPRKGMMSNYKLLFNTLHGDSQKVNFAGTRDLNEIVYDTVNNLYYGRLSNSNYLQSDAAVFGWHPYWIEDANSYYPYSLLSTICFFSYDVNENDGSCYDQDAIRKWKTTRMIDSARAHKIRVLLTLTSYGEDRNKKFLTNREAWAPLGDSIKALLQARKAQGIDIDFAGIPLDCREKFKNFITTLHKKIGDTCILTLHITLRDLKNQSLDFTGLNEQVSLFIVQGYDYEEYANKRGPMAPLYINSTINKKLLVTENKKSKQVAVEIITDNSIASIISTCLHNGLEPGKLLLNLPLYGTIWQGSEPREMSYDDIVSIYEKNNTHQLDLWSESALIQLHGKKDTVIYYESSESLDHKFQWAKAHGLRGVGLWGLGYDGGHAEVWQAVSNNFGVLPVRAITPFSEDNGLFYSILYALQKYRKPVGVGIAIITFFFIAGFLLSLLDWRVREVLFRSYINRALISFVIILFLFSTFYFLMDDTRATVANLLPLFIGLALGGVIVYLTTKLYMNYRKKMP